MEFDAVSYEEWISKVKKELKVDSLSDKDIDFGYGVQYSPFFQRKNYGSVHTQRIEQKWLIGETFDASIATNQDIMTSLEGGIQSIHLENVNKDSDVSKLLDGVYLDLVELHIVNPTNSQLVLQKMDHLLIESKTPLNITFRSRDELHEVHPSINIPKVIFVDWKDQESLLHAIRDAVKYLEEANNPNWSELINTIIISTNVLQETIKHVTYMESFRKLWWNVCNSMNGDYLIPEIEQHINPDKSIDRDSNFIQNSVCAVNAIISGCDRLITHPQNDDENLNFVKRINRNTQHLLQLESFMQKSAYAYQGSYVIEEMSSKIAKAVWNKI